MFDPSSIILFVGAACILAFIIHGLWFSDRPKNRKLEKDSERDQELSKARQVGKVRIVSSDLGSSDGQDSESIKISKESSTHQAGSKTKVRVSVRVPESADNFGIEDVQNNASIAVNPQRPNSSLSVQPQIYEPQSSVPNYPDADEFKPDRDVYEIILAADKERPYLGADIEALCAQYGFIQGYIQDNFKIYFVYENATTKDNEVFRICSMEYPYYFPDNMQNFSTSSIALYMRLPQRGKGFAYFKALRMASEIFIDQLGGVMEDQHRMPLSAEALDQMALELQRYDGGRTALNQ